MASCTMWQTSTCLHHFASLAVSCRLALQCDHGPTEFPLFARPPSSKFFSSGAVDSSFSSSALNINDVGKCQDDVLPLYAGGKLELLLSKSYAVRDAAGQPAPASFLEETAVHAKPAPALQRCTWRRLLQQGNNCQNGSDL